MADKIDISICCITYNQARYVNKMLESILEQKTDYTYEIIIHDDASTDETADIVRGYAKRHPNIIRTILQKENQFSSGKTNILFDQLFSVAKGEYIAVCEGDDYWCCKEKLDKQIKFMKLHPECSMCTHKTRVVQEDGKATNKTIPTYAVRIITSGKEYLKKCLEVDSHLFHTSSIFFKRQCLDGIIESTPGFISQTPVEDRALFWLLATKGEIGYIDLEMSCYRSMSVGSWTSTMEASYVKKYQKNLALLKMARLFNEYTKGEFAKEFYDYETNYLFMCYEYELNCKKMVKKRFRKQWKALNPKEKLFFGVCVIFPMLGIWYRRIKWAKEGKI